MCSDLGLFWQYTMYMCSLRSCSWSKTKNNKKIFLRCEKFNKLLQTKTVFTCLINKGASLSGSSKHFSSSPRKKLWTNRIMISPGQFFNYYYVHLQAYIIFSKELTLCASRKSDGCFQRQFYLFLSCHLELLHLSSGSCSPKDRKVNSYVKPAVYITYT